MELSRIRYMINSYLRIRLGMKSYLVSKKLYFCLFFKYYVPQCMYEYLVNGLYLDIC